MEKEKSADLKSAVVDIIRMAESTSAKFDVVMYEYFATCKCPHRGAVEAVVLHWLRNKTLIKSAILAACRKRPKNAVFAVLKGAAAEAMSAESGKYAQTIHSWVEFSKRKLSKNESSFINAVLRKLETNIATLESGGDGAEHLSINYSHPKWLVEKWLGEFRSDTTLRILESNQRPSDVFFRKSPDPKADAAFVPFEKFFEKTEYANFFKLKSGHWRDAKRLLETPYFYVQDPSTFFAPSQFAPKDGDFLDLCAAPGGKSRAIADICFANSADVKKCSLVSVDVPERTAPLVENMQKVGFMKTVVLECDILKDDLQKKLSERNLPTSFDGVFVDAPCSNTGVLRRRPDARYRLNSEDISNCAKKQGEILEVAKNFVKAGGKLEYSTCSIEREENDCVVEKFLAANKNFALKENRILLPDAQNDGAGFALFERLF